MKFSLSLKDEFPYFFQTHSQFFFPILFPGLENLFSIFHTFQGFPDSVRTLIFIVNHNKGTLNIN